MRALAVLLALALAAAAAGASPADRGPFTRTCRTSVWGDLGTGWARSSVVAGPLAFVRAQGYADSTAAFADVGGGRYRGAKLLVVVRTGWKARVVVPDEQLALVALQYDPADFNRAVVPALSVHDVTFAACPPGRPLLGPRSERWTQFNGGGVVAGRRCVTLEIRAAKLGRALPPRPSIARLSLGAGACSR